MNDQLRLPGLDPPRQVRPASERSEPAVWVQKLCIVRELQPGSAHLVRSIELRRGLNILWAPPKQGENGNALFRDAVTGHTAGKTTFCRLIRYVLGEQTFAAEGTRRRIRETFPSGWVLGEVVIAGKLWAVARPFAVGAHPFAVRDATVQVVLDAKVDRVDFQTFVNEIEAATVATLPARQFPANDVAVRWDHLLPWLARDQECRFADVLEWRHSTASSGAPVLGTDDRQFLVRSVLGLISDEERTEQQRNAQLVAQKREEGRGNFPRFLIHDGPREADMAPDIYERLFLFAQQLEQYFDDEPSFQYIITTTAPPPAALCGEPWLLRPVLDASKAAGRLLGVNL